MIISDLIDVPIVRLYRLALEAIKIRELARPGFWESNMGTAWQRANRGLRAAERDPKALLPKPLPGEEAWEHYFVPADCGGLRISELIELALEAKTRREDQQIARAIGREIWP